MGRHRTALVDGDTLVYASTTASERAIDWGDDLWTLHGFENEANDHFDSLVAEIRDAVDADEVIIALSCTDPQRWREDIMPSYKAHRREKRKPLMYSTIREYCHKKYKTLERPKLEGDDILGILATHPNLALLEPGTERICVSIDKDLKTIPGQHYNYQKGTLFEIAPCVADYYHMMQTLTGDTTDGYPGCPGIGPVTALKVLGLVEGQDLSDFSVREAWPKVVAAYAKKGLSEEIALLNARVARICRAEDYDMNKKEVILWNPPVA